MFSKVMVLLVIYVYFLMSVLDENIGTIYKRVYDMYDMRLHTYPGNAVNQVYDMLRLRKYPVEDMPSKKELYRMIQDELVQFGFVSFFEFTPTTGLPENGYLPPKYLGVGPHLRIQDKKGWELGYITITEEQ